MVAFRKVAPSGVTARPDETCGATTVLARAPGLAGVVLCGGRSARMGVDKATITFDGTTLLERALARLDAVCDPVLIAAGRCARHASPAGARSLMRCLERGRSAGSSRRCAHHRTGCSRSSPSTSHGSIRVSSGCWRRAHRRPRRGRVRDGSRHRAAARRVRHLDARCGGGRARRVGSIAAASDRAESAPCVSRRASGATRGSPTGSLATSTLPQDLAEVSRRHPQ